jgi:hypothetical protein
MTAKTTDKVLRAVTQRVMDSFTAQGALFTALDVSNAVKGTLPDIRHREVAPIVRDLYERGAMGDYRQDLIDVLADGHKPVQAYLYHLPEHDVDLYDDSMRNQLSIPPVSTSTDASGEGNLSSHSTEAPVLVGRDGRARIARQLLMNAGIVSEEISAVGQGSPASSPSPPRRAPRPPAPRPPCWSTSTPRCCTSLAGSWASSTPARSWWRGSTPTGWRSSARSDRPRSALVTLRRVE